MCEQGEGPGQGTGGGKDFGALTHHLQQQPQQNSHTTQGGKDALKTSCYLGFYWGRGGKKEVAGNNRALSQNKLIDHVLHGSVEVPQ